MSTAPSAFPLLGAPQAPGDETPEEGNSLGGRPPEAGGKIQLPRHTRPDPRRSLHGRPKCDPTTECSSYKKLRYLFHAPPNVKVWHKAFFVGLGAGALPIRTRHFPKMPTAPSTFPLLGAPQAPGDHPPPKGVIAWGEEKIQLPRRTRPDPHRSQHGRPKWDPTIESAKSCSYKKLLFASSLPWY